MSNIYNNGGFFWWMGVVEDRFDPLYLGRCRVRIVGYHNPNIEALPIGDLPWAYPMQPITSAAISGIGHAPVGPVEGTWIIGFFRDGGDCQEPVMMGTVGGVPQSGYVNSLTSKTGFQDPTQKYPRKNLLDEPDTNRLARGQGVDETIVGEKKNTRTKAVPIAKDSGTWDQPEIPYFAKYPFNHVFVSETGHAIEVDDTEAGERLHIYHRKGSFVEVDPNGTMVRKIVGDDYEIVERNKSVYIKGKLNVTVDGSCNVYVKNNCVLHVDGNLDTQVHKDYNLNVAGKMNVTVGDNISIKTKKEMKLGAEKALSIKTDDSMKIEAGKTVDMLAKTTMKIMGTAKTSIGSPVTEVAILKMGGMSITPIPPPKAGGASMPTVPDPVSTKSPTEPTFGELGFKLDAAAIAAAVAEKILAEQIAQDPTVPADARVAAGEYAELKDAEIQSGEANSIPSPEPPVEALANTPTDFVCEIGKRVVQAAEADIGILETGTAANNGVGLNYGGKRKSANSPAGELPRGVAGRIDEMMGNAGLNNQQEVASKGSGFYWCAGAVTTWWKEAGLPTPPGPAACRNWSSWARQNGYFSQTPVIGAAVLYGGLGSENHIGIVIGISTTGRVTTIEGNTSGGGFSRNGVGCFAKNVNPLRITGYVIPPGCKVKP